LSHCMIVAFFTIFVTVPERTFTSKPPANRFHINIVDCHR
jgi:hypothetical protein